MDPTNPSVFTPAEAAVELRASESFLRTKARLEEIPHFRVGRGAIRFTAADIEEIKAILARPVTAKATRVTSPRARKRAA